MLDVQDVVVSAEIDDVITSSFYDSGQYPTVGITYMIIRDPIESTVNSSPYLKWEKMTQRESWIKIPKKEVIV